MTQSGAKNRAGRENPSVEGPENVSLNPAPDLPADKTTDAKITGVAFGRGQAMGRVVFYDAITAVEGETAQDAALELRRLHRAVESMHEAINRMLHHNPTSAVAETRDILEAYQMFARDRGWLTRIEQAINRGLTAEAAVLRVLGDTRTRMMQVRDNYIRERLQDIEDLSQRLLSHLARLDAAQAQKALPDDIILVARSLGPAALLDFDRDKLKGVVLEEGSYSSHVAIVARSLGIPIVGRCGAIERLMTEGDPLIVDGDRGVVYLRPSSYDVDTYVRSVEARSVRSGVYRRTRHQPAVTKNGVNISVQANAGLLSEVAELQKLGADGIGLFRTEISFMAWRKYPLVVTQAELYSKVLDAMGDQPVVFRTLDIGGDKPLPYFKAPQEENPALGWRALRIGLDRPAVLRTQFRAFIRGSKGRDIRIMLPLVTSVAEVDRVRELLDMEKARAAEAGIPVPAKIALGVMIEVPSLLFQLETLLEQIDFVSVGTNDLMQYLHAADRGSDIMRNRYDPLNPAMLRALKLVADQCRVAGVPLSVCGEMAGHPLEAMVLIALGYETLSVPAQAVESIKMMIPTLDTGSFLPYLEVLMKSREPSLRERLLSFARDHKVSLAPDA